MKILCKKKLFKKSLFKKSLSNFIKLNSCLSQNAHGPGILNIMVLIRN